MSDTCMMLAPWVNGMCGVREGSSVAAGWDGEVPKAATAQVEDGAA